MNTKPPRYRWLVMPLATGGIFACAAPAFAVLTETDLLLDELPVVLSASRLSQPVNETPAAMTVIDRDMIRASGFRDIPDLLRLVPGFSVAFTRDNTWAVGYHGMADAFSRRFQVLVDGRSIYSAAFGAVHWHELPLSIDDIERIEVVRGPNAATFGANAFFAVINIVTQEAVQVRGNFASLQAGEQGMAGATLRRGGRAGEVDYRLTFSAQDRDRFETDDASGGSTGKLFEQSRTYVLNGRFDHRPSAFDEVSAQFGASVGDWQAGRLYSPPKVDHSLEPRQQDVDTQYLQFKYRHHPDADNEWMLQFYHSRHRVEAPSRANAHGFTIVGDQDALQTRTNLEFQATARVAPSVRASWGAEVRRETVESPLYFGDAATRSGVLGRVFANLEWRARRDLLLHGGAMLEHHYYTGLDVSPRLAANYDLAPGHTLRLNVSQAYRTPTFLEQDGYYVYRSTTGLALDVIGVTPNDLAPERIRSHEIGYVGHYRPWQLQVDAKLFHDRVDEYIGTTKTSLPVGTELLSGGAPGSARAPLNGGGLTLRGGEVQLAWQPVRDLRLLAQYARVSISVDSTLDAIDDDVKDSVPHDNFSLLARYALPHGWSASAGVYHTGRMTWLGDGDPVPAHTRIDARLARKWVWDGRAVEAALVGQSLGGDVSEFRGENRFSRRVYASLSIGW